MIYEFEILESDLKDRNKIIAMKEEINKRVNELSDFGKNTMVRPLKQLIENLEWCENAWLIVQRDKVHNELSAALNLDRENFCEEYGYGSE